ncbi:dihydroorotase [Vibrio astriarenae]|nr:dihydroorotase [Vibrio sp. C7]
MSTTVFKNAKIVNEGQIIETDVKVVGSRIEAIANNIEVVASDTVIDAQGKYLLPGMIDDQVHFREPGLTHKGTIASESRAAWQVGLPVLWKCQM